MMTAPNQVDKEMSHLFFNLFELDPEDEQESFFMSVLIDISPKHEKHSTSLFSHEDLLMIGLNLPVHLGMEVKSIQF